MTNARYEMLVIATLHAVIFLDLIFVNASSASLATGNLAFGIEVCRI